MRLIGPGRVASQASRANHGSWFALLDVRPIVECYRFLAGAFVLSNVAGEVTKPSVSV
jgi:hypothetical protein